MHGRRPRPDERAVASSTFSAAGTPAGAWSCGATRSTTSAPSPSPTSEPSARLPRPVGRPLPRTPSYPGRARLRPRATDACLAPPKCLACCRGNRRTGIESLAPSSGRHILPAGSLIRVRPLNASAPAPPTSRRHDRGVPSPPRGAPFGPGSGHTAEASKASFLDLPDPGSGRAPWWSSLTCRPPT